MSAPPSPTRHDSSSVSARPVSLFLSLCLFVALGAACGADADTLDPALAIDAPSEYLELAWSMAADALAEVGELDGDAVVVPSNDALLALDADALADLMSTDGLEEMIRSSVVRAGFDQAANAGDLYLLSDGTSVPVTAAEGQLLLDQLPLLETVEVGDVTVLVVDGIMVEP